MLYEIKEVDLRTCKLYGYVEAKSIEEALDKAGKRSIFGYTDKDVGNILLHAEPIKQDD